MPSLHARGEMYSIEYVVPAEVRDPWRGGGGGGSRNFSLRCVRASADEGRKTSVWSMEGGMASTGRLAVSPKFLGVVVSAVIPRGRWNHSFGAGEYSGLDERDGRLCSLGGRRRR